ncbi:NAD(P)-binding protein [Mycena floridula]|nr:NAD(P)-binding protein [Mycena floridula]
MKIAVTGCSGSVGTRVVALALRRGHAVVGLDVEQRDLPTSSGNFIFIKVDIQSYPDTLKALEGCDAIIHLAACSNPKDYVVETHNTNVVASWNVLRAAAELSIFRVAQASSVNVLAMVYSRATQFDYFPIDENHPCRPDEPYGLSKVICEMQASTIVRRYPGMRIASLRLSWSRPDRSAATNDDPASRSTDLWGYVQEDSGADAFLRAVEKDDSSWSGHEAFFIVAPEVAAQQDSQTLWKQFYSEVPSRDVKGATTCIDKPIGGKMGFFDCSKAERLLGWRHAD